MARAAALAPAHAWASDPSWVLSKAVTDTTMGLPLKVGVAAADDDDDEDEDDLLEPPQPAMAAASAVAMTSVFTAL
jgi:hypothetical protein